MFQSVCLPLHTIQEEPLPVHLKNKIETITFSLEVFQLIGKLNKIGWSYVFSFYILKNLTCNMKLVWGSTAALMYGICGIEIPVVFPLLKVVWPEYITLIRLMP